MTNHWNDIQHSDCVLIQGSNAAENHPISFKWVMKAKDKGAEVIHVDPRFTRTSARSTMYAPIRSGTDIAFLGGMIKYIIDNNLYFEDYVLNYTNAANIVSKDFNFKDGLFSGYNPETRSYDKSTWTLDLDENGVPVKDLTLKNPRCVINLLKAHYKRYSISKVSSITGTPKADLEKVYKAFSATGKADKAGTIMYALGQCHHTVAVQNIRCFGIIQLLLGNIGICGGGINALRGEPNVQGSTDHALLYHYLPGYLSAPRASQDSLAAYTKKVSGATNNEQSINWTSNYGKYATSLLRAFFPTGTNKANDFGYHFVPKVDDNQDCSAMNMIDDMYNGKIKILTCVGQNPCGSLPNTNKVRAAMLNLDFMVHVNIFDNESASFWRGPGVDPLKQGTECFLLPATSSIEKEGSQSNSGRWVQWKYSATKSVGQCLSTGDIMWRITSKLKALYKAKGGAFPAPLVNVNTDLATNGKFDAEKVAKIINGRFLVDKTINGVRYRKGDCVPGFTLLQDDGSTSCGNWVISGSFTAKGTNLMKRRSKKDPTNLSLFPEWAYAWPLDRRIIYNRASCDANGKPYNPARALVEYKDGKWVGDVVDGGGAPLAHENGKLPFIMKPEGVGSLFGPGLAEGPFPEHYEPLEGPFATNKMSKQRINPAIKLFDGEMDKVANASKEFPIVMTTYSCTEHWATGAFTRPQPWLMELMPGAYVEMSHELAKEKGIENGEKVRVVSARGEVEAVAMVTVRIKPFKCGSKVHHAGMTYNYGWRWPEGTKDDTANILTPTAGDANSQTPEYKAFMVDIRKIA